MPYEFNPFTEEFDFYPYEPTEYKAKGPGGWSSLPDLPHVLRGAAFASTPEGDLFVAGGEDDKNYFYTYDASSGTWTTMTDLPFTVAGAFGAYLSSSGTFHVIGGVDSDYNKLKTHYVWDGSSWTSSGSLNTERYSHSGCVYDGDIYVSHGRDGSTNFLTSIEKWTPSTSAFSTLSNSAAHARYTQDAAVLNGKMVVCCGFDGADTRYIEEFDFATETWSDKTPSSGPPTARRYVVCGTVVDKVYIAIGYYSGHTSGSQLVESWDGSVCQTEDDCPSPARWVCGHGDFRDGKLYLIGGETSSNIADVDVLSQECYPIKEEC